MKNGTPVRSIRTHRNPRHSVLPGKSCASGGKRSIIGFSIFGIRWSVPPRSLVQTKHDEVRDDFTGAASFSGVPSGWRRAQSYGKFGGSVWGRTFGKLPPMTNAGCISVLFYSSGASPQYEDHEEIVLWMNTVGPYHNRQETYAYFSLPFCVGTKQTINHYHETMSEALQGVELEFSGYEIDFKGTYNGVSLHYCSEWKVWCGETEGMAG